MSQKICNIYLDHAASTPDESRPISLVDMDYWGGDGNSHSIHQMGLEAAKAIEKAEKVILDYINGHDGKLMYVGSGSQANELAIRAMCESHTLLTSSIEHKSIMQHCETFAYDIVKPNKYGTVMLDDILPRVLSGTDMVSIQMINNITGIVQPVGDIKRNIPDNVFLHTDAVQALGKIPIDVNHLGVDLMTMSSHKAYGPKGLGILWIRNKALDHRRPFFQYLGTKPTELICRFASSLKRIHIQDNTERVAILEDEFFKCLRNTHVEYNLVAGSNRVVGLFAIQFPGVDADDLVFSLSTKGVYISSGSACDNGKVEPSHVLTEMGIIPEVARETVRFSIGHSNTMIEVQQAADIIIDTVKELKNGS